MTDPKDNEIGAEDIPEQAAAWLDQGQGVALATVVATWGSSPRPAGSQMAIAEKGRFAGSVSGGCIESTVADAAARAIAGGPPTVLEFGVTDEMAWEVGLTCGGTIRVLIERVGGAGGMARETLDALIAARAGKRAVALATDLESGVQALVFAETDQGALALDIDGLSAARTALRRDKATTIESGTTTIFVQPFNPPLRLIVVGAVHIAQALAPMAALAGYTVTVIDPRRAFATLERMPGIALRAEWPDKALEYLAPDARSAVVALTHDPKLDDPALIRALGSDAFYIGALGSKRSHAKRLARLAGQGVGETDLARIHGPVGLAIGAVSPAEIAVSILAEMTSVRHGVATP
ncbi:MAG: XdhC family protein [Alphaproteobacteria bacterium]